MGNEEIRNANKKALPKFLLLCIIGALIGGIAGYYIAANGLDELSGSMKLAGLKFGMYVAPWIMVVIAVAIPVMAIPYYKKAKNQLLTWDGENEEISDSIEQKLSMVQWISSVAIIISYFLIAASYSGGTSIFENAKSSLGFGMGVFAFICILVEVVVIQQKSVDCIKVMNPEKKASVYDIKFQKKWMEDCDEAEKIVIGKCAYKAFNITNSMCSVLAIILAVSALAFNTGFLPSLVVCLIWIVNVSVYSKECMKYSKAGNKIM